LRKLRAMSDQPSRTPTQHQARFAAQSFFIQPARTEALPGSPKETGSDVNLLVESASASAASVLPRLMYGLRGCGAIHKTSPPARTNCSTAHNVGLAPQSRSLSPSGASFSRIKTSPFVALLAHITCLLAVVHAPWSWECISTYPYQFRLICPRTPPLSDLQEPSFWHA